MEVKKILKSNKIYLTGSKCLNSIIHAGVYDVTLDGMFIIK